MSETNHGWRYYLPEQGETINDARAIVVHSTRIDTPEDAAQSACEYDYYHCDGWERRGMNSEFVIAVIAPDGAETRWWAMHDQSVDHHVYEVEDVDE